MKRHLFRRMGRFLRPQASSLAGAAALAALSGLLALLVPLVAGWAVEAIGTGPGAADLTAVLRYCAAGLGAAVLSAVCSYGASAALVRVGQPYPTHCGRQLFSKSLSYRSGILTPTRRGI